MNQNLNMQIADLNRQLADLNLQLLKQLDAAQAEIAKLQAELETERNKLKENDMLSPVQAARLIGRSVSYLSKDRKKGEGKNLIPYIQERPEAAVKYRRHDLQVFIEQNKKPGKLRLSA